jgi:hypothetical protein
MPTTPNSKSRLFPMGGFAANRLSFDEEGKLSDDGASYDLDELSLEDKNVTDEEVMNMLASKHRFNDKGKVFHIAIIDYLQSWNCNKKGETFAKNVILGNKKEDISSMPPIPYGDRFLSFMKKEVFV